MVPRLTTANVIKCQLEAGLIQLIRASMRALMCKGLFKIKSCVEMSSTSDTGGLCVSLPISEFTKSAEGRGF
jgi:hypothetical protein